MKVNPDYLSVNWESGGGGAFAVIPLNERGKIPDVIPLFRGHTAVVLDTDWHPFNDRIIASGSDDGKIFIWEVPKDFTLFTDAEEPADVTPVSKLAGHSRYVAGWPQLWNAGGGAWDPSNARTGRSAKSSSTPPPRTSSPLPLATLASSCGMSAPASPHWR